jgi:hypothetical protein
MGVGLVAVTTALNLTEVRAAAAAALAPVADTDPDIYPLWSDAVFPPALMLGWWDPWVEVRSMAGGLGLFDAQLNIQCVASRVDPGAGFEELEALVVYCVSRLAQDSHSWALTAATTPRQWKSGDIPLLGADLAFRVPVQIQEV